MTGIENSINGFFRTIRVLTSSEVKNLHGTPITIIPAQGAGKLINLVNVTSKMIYGGNNVFVAGAAQIISLRYGSGTSAVACATALSNTSIVASASNYCFQCALSATTNQAIANYENMLISIYNSNATEISGNANDDNTITIEIVYYVTNI